jgi:Sel1 repeat
LQRQDYVTAERLYRSLAEQGDASAQHFLGKMYESGEGVRRDPVEAAKWFRLAADQGHTAPSFIWAGCTPVATACRVTTCKRICGSISVQRGHKSFCGGESFRSSGQDDARASR